MSLVDLGLSGGLQANSVLDVEVTVNTEATTGIVFDYYGADDFKYAGISADNNTLVIGHFIGGKWVVDAATDLKIKAGADYELALSLKGTTVDVALKAEGAQNWQAMAGHVFNAVTVDGDFGLLAKDGMASFDSVTIRTDDPAFRDAALVAATAAADPSAGEALSDESLAPIVAAAIDRWSASGLVDEVALARMAGVDFTIADLDGLLLGRTDDGEVTIDIDGAGHGWFVDSTPADDAEFVADGSGSLVAPGDSEAAGNMDLLSAVMHELGHAAGYQHDDQGVMDAELAAGERATALVFDDVSGELSDASAKRSWQNDPLLQIDPSKWYKVGAKWDHEADDEWMIRI
ncbi:MAG: hypothetical protein C0619_11450 [Desulfuromonas sp.]|nr:MAG: hypothetical protein C0619_11450 [Desulfuromonas sp.]